MLSFQLLGFPVRIEWMFWILCAILGMGFLEMAGPQGLGMFLIMTAVVLGSILWHELGHAMARRHFGQPDSEIILHSLGGVCTGPGWFTRWETVAISAAGPAAGFLLGGVTWLVVFTPGIADPWIRFFVDQMLWVNIGWSIFNLFPILPLDGGRIFEALVPDRHRRIVPKVGFILALILAAAGLLVYESLFMAMMCGLLAHGNWRRMQGFGAGFR
jgi:Zn-dependent protease